TLVSCLVPCQEYQPSLLPSQFPGSVAGAQLDPCDRFDASKACGVMKLHLAVEVLDIGERQCRVSKSGSAAQQIVHGRCTISRGMLALGVERDEHTDLLLLQSSYGDETQSGS